MHHFPRPDGPLDLGDAVTTLTLIIFAVMIVAAITRHGYWRALAVGGATPVGAALVIGDIAVPTFYMAAIGALVGLLIRQLRRTRDPETHRVPRFPGAIPLILFVVWSIIVTFTAPLFFGGAEVLAADGSTQVLRAGALTTSNMAQMIYLILSVSVVFFLARSQRLAPGVVGIAASLVTLLSLWRLLNQTFGLPFPEGVFDNSPFFAFIETEVGGAPRFRGILSEPSGLAGASLVTIAYALNRATQLRGLRRLGILMVAAAAAYMALISTSATFVVAGLALSLVAVLSGVGHVFIRRGGVPHAVIVAAGAAAVAALWVLPWLVNAVGEVVNDKVASSSFEARSGADDRSYALVFETLGYGVGLGAHRPSSFVAGLLSTTGVIGTILFAAAVWSIVRSAQRSREFRPVLWAFAAVLITKVIAGPDLADTSGILWLSLGALAYVGAREQYSPEHFRSGRRPVIDDRLV